MMYLPQLLHNFYLKGREGGPTRACSPAFRLLRGQAKQVMRFMRLWLDQGFPQFPWVLPGFCWVPSFLLGFSRFSYPQLAPLEGRKHWRGTGLVHLQIGMTSHSFALSP